MFTSTRGEDFNIIWRTQFNHDTHLSRKGHSKANTAVSSLQNQPGFWVSQERMSFVKG